MRAGITIDSVEYSFWENSLILESNLGRRISLARFEVEGTAPSGKDEVSIYRADTPYENAAIAPVAAMGGQSTYLDYFFGGYLAQIEPRLRGVTPTYYCVAQDYNILPAQISVTKSYTTKTSKEIIDDLFTAYLDIISTDDVEDTVATITVDWTRVFLDKVLDELAAIFGMRWYIDYNKHLQFFTPTDDTAPFQLSAAPYLTIAIPYTQHSHIEDHSRIVNKFTVIGDTTVPVVVTRTDSDSYTLYGRYFEDKIVDHNIDTDAWATLVGDAYLSENASARVNGNLVCNQEGLVVGQKVKVINALKSIDAYYTVQSIVLSMLGGLTERVDVAYGDYRPGLVEMLVRVKQLESKEA